MLCLLLTRFPGSTCSGGGGGRGAAVWGGDLQSRFDDEGGFLGPRAFPNTQRQSWGKAKPASVDLSVVSVSGPERIFIGAGDKSEIHDQKGDEAGEKECRGGRDLLHLPRGHLGRAEGGKH